MERKVFAIRHNSKALQLCLWGTSTAGRILVLFGHQICSLRVLSPFNSDFRYSFDLFSTHLQQISLGVLSLGQNMHTMNCIARRERTPWQSLSNGKLSPVYLNIDPALPHTLRESLACALWSSLANLLPWPAASHQTCSGKPQQLFLVWHLWVCPCSIWLSHLHKQLHLSCRSLLENWFKCILTVQCLAYACLVTQMLPFLLFLWVHQGWIGCQLCTRNCCPFFQQGSSADQAESWWGAFASPLSDAVLLSVAWEGGRCMLNWQFYWAAFQPRGK